MLLYVPALLSVYPDSSLEKSGAHAVDEAEMVRKRRKDSSCFFMWDSTSGSPKWFSRLQHRREVRRLGQVKRIVIHWVNHVCGECRSCVVARQDKSKYSRDSVLVSDDDSAESRLVALGHNAAESIHVALPQALLTFRRPLRARCGCPFVPPKGRILRAVRRSRDVHVYICMVE